jgi:hypothetical protein
MIWTASQFTQEVFSYRGLNLLPFSHLISLFYPFFNPNQGDLYDNKRCYSNRHYRIDC